MVSPWKKCCGICWHIIVGGKGQSDLFEFAKSTKVNIVALCDVDDRQAVKSREANPKAPYYKDFREMLAKEKNNIDAVSISTPDHTHAIATLSAMQLGKHVYTVNIFQLQHFFPGIRVACKNLWHFLSAFCNHFF